MRQKQGRVIVRTAAPVLRSRYIRKEPTRHAAAPSAVFPAFGHAVQPVQAVPNWGAMRSPKEWNRSYAEMDERDFVPVPDYDLTTLTIPIQSLLKRAPGQVATLTDKLFYSTRYFGAYDLDAGEFTGAHAGIDLKLAEGTPVGAIAGG